MLVPRDELDRRRVTLDEAGGFAVPKSQTPWQEIYRNLVDQMAEGQLLRGADRYQRVAQTSIPRDNH